MDISSHPYCVCDIQAFLASGYRPRFLVAEINRNFPLTSQAYSTLNLFNQAWEFTCYQGASPLAMTRLAQFFGYRPLIFDRELINMFFVHTDAIGSLPPSDDYVSSSTSDPDLLDSDFSLHAAAAALSLASNGQLEGNWVLGVGTNIRPVSICPYSTWAHIPSDVDFERLDFERQLRAVVLASNTTGGKRYFHEADVHGVPGGFAWPGPEP